MLDNNSLLDDENTNSETGAFRASVIEQYTKLTYWIKFFTITNLVFLILAALVALYLGIIFIPNLMAERGATTDTTYWIFAFVIGIIVVAFTSWLLSLLWRYHKGLQEFVDNRDENQLLLAMARRKTYFTVYLVLMGLSISSALRGLLALV